MTIEETAIFYKSKLIFQEARQENESSICHAPGDVCIYMSKGITFYKKTIHHEKALRPWKDTMQSYEH